MTQARVRFALAAGVLFAAAGCAQVFGLGDYGQQPEEAGATGSDATAGSETAPPADGGSGRDAGDAHPSSDGGGHFDATSADAVAEGPTFPPDACSGGYVCAPAAPMGWTGPVALWEGASGVPSCPAYYYAGFAGGISPSAAAAQCTCSCGAPSGSTCGAAQLQLGTGGCSSTSGCSGVSLTPTVCTSVQSAVTACGSGSGFTVDGSAAMGGSCQPDASTSLPAATWTTQALACAPTGQTPVGCASGQTCVPATGSPFETQFCVLQAGVNSCPTGFPTQHTYFGGIDDTRGCSTCTCAAPSGVDCNSGAQVTTFGNPSCGGSQGPTVSPLPSSGCTSASGIKSVRLTTSPSGGSCSPIGGQPMGNVTAQTATTICCTL